MEGFTFQNWAKTFSCKPELYFEPEDVDELRQIVETAREEGKRVKVIGTGHSPSNIACTAGYMVCMKNISKVLEVDRTKNRVKVEAGIQLKTLNESVLPSYGMGLSVLGSISDQTAAGAIATGTHGTGYNYGIMATSIVDLELLTSSGEILYCSEDDKPELFSAARCSLGALGIILNMTIQCEPAYKLHDLQTSSTLDDVLDNLDMYVRSSEHFRFMWYPHTDYVMMSRVNRTEKKMTKNRSSWFWDTLLGFYTLEFLYWLSCFFQPLVPWINALHFRLFASLPKERVDISHRVFNFNCLFKQHVTDWAIPTHKIGQVLRELKRRIECETVYAHMPTEVRFAKADDIMLSPANGRSTCFINIIHYRPYGKQVFNHRYWTIYEDIVRKAGGRPHWAKDHPLRCGDFDRLYPRWSEFCRIRKQLDPTGVFLNAYLEKIFSDP